MQNQTIADLDDVCSGCGACTLVCPTKAISIEYNDKGFFEARINEQQCVRCGRCTTVCIKDNEYIDIPRLEEGKLFASVSKNASTLMNSSSGGIVSEAYATALKKGYSIVGTVYNYDLDQTEMHLSKDKDAIKSFSGSKYIQSYTVDAFRDAILYAKEDKKNRVMIVGTPCQIFGIDRALEALDLREQFILVDFFCHGVPSYLVWNAYLKNVKKYLKSDKLNEIKFREKKNGWHNYWIEMSAGSRKYSEMGSLDMFYEAFFDNQFMNDRCFTCRLRAEYSKADIRVGDFWGKEFQSNDTGVSAVIILSDVGAKFFEEIAGIEIIGEYDIRKFVLSQSHKEYQKSKCREEAFSILKKTGNLQKAMSVYQSYKERAKVQMKKCIAVLPKESKKFFRRKGLI